MLVKCAQNQSTAEEEMREAVGRALAAYPRHTSWLLQQYIRPLLLPLPPHPQSPAHTAGTQAGHKFHLRVWVLAVGALSVWVHDEPLVMCASEEWSEPTHTICERCNLDAHVTNHAQQQHSNSYEQARRTHGHADVCGEV